jgi:hypothetical protein
VKILSEGDCFLSFALGVSQADRFPSSYGTVLFLLTDDALFLISYLTLFLLSQIFSRGQKTTNTLSACHRVLSECTVQWMFT